MRTTVDLPDDIHTLARQLAHQQHKTFSEVISELIRAGLQPSHERRAAVPTGLPRVAVGRVVTAEDVRSLEDHE